MASKWALLSNPVLLLLGGRAGRLKPAGWQGTYGRMHLTKKQDGPTMHTGGHQAERGLGSSPEAWVLVLGCLLCLWGALTSPWVSTSPSNALKYLKC